MDNKELLKIAIEVGFDRERCARVTASDGLEAVQIPRDMEPLSKLEAQVPSLKSIDESFFHYWIIRA